MKGTLIALGIVGFVLSLTGTEAQASRPPRSDSKKTCTYSNSKCDPSGATYTCQDQACSTFSGTVGPWTISGGSSTFHKNANVNMKICVSNTGTSCVTNPKTCGEFKYYLSTNCTGAPLTQAGGWQEDCS